MSNISYTKFFFFLLLGIYSFTECKKDDTNRLSNYCGNYYLDNIYWTGEIVDFNGDGIGERDMLHEFSGYPGFVKEWIHGKVCLLDDSTLSFDSVIPACVKSESLVQPDMKYYDIAIKSTWHADWGIPKFSTETFLPGKTDLNKGIRSAVLYNIQESSYELHVACTLFTQEDGSIQGNMIYTFKR